MLVTAEGLASNSTVTIYAKNVVATVETEKAGEAMKSVTFPDTVKVGKTRSNTDGTLEWALGVPRDEVVIIERWISNSTGQEEVLKTVTTTYEFQETMQVIVADEFGNEASAELTVIKWIPKSPFDRLGLLASKSICSYASSEVQTDKVCLSLEMILFHEPSPPRRSE